MLIAVLTTFLCELYNVDRRIYVLLYVQLPFTLKFSLCIFKPWTSHIVSLTLCFLNSKVRMMIILAS